MFLVYSLFSLFFGQNGLYVRKHLEAEKIRLQESSTLLKYTKQDLLNYRNHLMHDKDSLAVYARQLGYGWENERHHRVVGLNVALNVDIPVGQVHYAVKPDYVPDSTIKIIAAFFGLVILVYFLVRDILLFKEMQS
jgi:hypothetical protein